ncbi:isochorismate synthase [Rheinheimera riviphila]|uniref:isochorismate synthase n=1 Tax=Rheinheimera riviphila TaxID=1834037 RepID=A0A437QIX3_9GAMM|nr:isochorismate synthase [Rheinheimera riviphila]RVU34497.1 isochorismate synthase [Rheinheimera riviphila]
MCPADICCSASQLTDDLAAADNMLLAPSGNPRWTDSKLLQGYLPAQSCIVAAGSQFLLTHGCYAQFQLPTNSPGLALLLQDKLAAAKADGVVEPVLIQLIPFDPGQNASFLIPRQVERIGADKLTTRLQQQAKTSAPLRLGHNKAAEFTRQVRQAVQLLQQPKLKKLVLGRAIECHSEQLDLADCLLSLLQQNPGAATFAVPLPGGEVWFGASPELLLARHGNQIRTQPLAGTCRRDLTDLTRDQAQAEVLRHSPKDRYEHQLVVQQISEVLAPYCKILQVPAEPSLLATSRLWHLASDIQAELVNADIPSLDILQLLHPTAAVCGQPTAAAREAIRQIETYQRDFFCGAVGWQDLAGNGQWQVMIRCARAKAGQLTLYAGAGIVSASEPAAELAETNAKFATMLGALGLPELTEAC